MSVPATAEEIREVLGSVDPNLLMDIQRTGASAGEVLEAFMRLQADDAVGSEARRSPGPKVAEVMAILEASEIEPEP